MRGGEIRIKVSFWHGFVVGYVLCWLVSILAGAWR